jgi:hypothetical protein
VTVTLTFVHRSNKGADYAMMTAMPGWRSW